MRFSLLLAVCFTVLVSAKASEYEFVDEMLPSLAGMQGLKIYPDSEEKRDLVAAYRDVYGFDMVSLPKILGEPITVFVSAENVELFKIILENNEIDYEIIIEDMEDTVKEESLKQRVAQKEESLKRRAAGISFKYYPRYSEIVDYLAYLNRTYSKVATVVQIGRTFENRPLYALKISANPSGPKKPSIVVDAGIHAREWIAPITSLYLAHQLVENSKYASLYKNIDWYIVPSLNPDGYEYTHTKYRMWRKTRSTGNSLTCVGTDANRNFGYKWMTIGASSSPCADTYAGPKAFSEPETKALRDFVLSLKGSVKMYLTLHSYGQYMLHPWGYTSALPPNEPELRNAAEKAHKALKAVRGTTYTIGSSTNVLYAAAGGSDDWAMAVGGATYSYTIELPGGGSQGFDLPPSKIGPVVEETFEAFKAFGEHLQKKV